MSASFAESLVDLPAPARAFGYDRFFADLCAGEIHAPEEGLARSFRLREGFPELVLTVGPCGAGKSTWIERHLGDHQRISLDEIRAELGDRSDQSQNARVRQIARDRLREGLRGNKRLVWDATGLHRDHRDAVTNMARDYGALITLVTFPRTAREYQRRNRERATAVPAFVIDRQLAAMQWPELAEGHRWLVIGAEGQVLAHYGGLDPQLPYGLTADEQTLREPGL